jgi:hypothetical protein
MILLEDILIDENILKAKFSCDLGACKGACCTFPGDLGAPLADSEVQLMIDAVEPSRKYLSERALDYIEKHGVFQGEKGSYTTQCIDRCDCVFVYYEGDVAKCAIEKAYFAGEYEFRKPISCHLFPIRESFYAGKYLYYQKINECASAVRCGEREDIPLLDSLSEAIERAYGHEWHELLMAYSKNRSRK